MNILGKTAFITGGASGLGAACARMIQAAGGRTAIVDTNAASGRQLADEIGGRFFLADVTSREQVAEAIAATGPIHIAINCAGIGYAERVLGKEGPASLEKFARVIQVNLIGTYNAIRLAAARMNENEPGGDGERGVIVCTASIAAFDGQIGQSAYSASKAGIAGMTLPLARDLSRHGIRVMTIAPGIFDTPLLGALPDDVRASLGASVPFPARLGRPAEYAQLAQQIVENQMLNGEVIRLDGALRMPPK